MSVGYHLCQWVSVDSMQLACMETCTHTHTPCALHSVSVRVTAGWVVDESLQHVPLRVLSPMQQPDMEHVTSIYIHSSLQHVYSTFFSKCALALWYFLSSFSESCCDLEPTVGVIVSLPHILIHNHATNLDRCFPSLSCSSIHFPCCFLTALSIDWPSATFSCNSAICCLRWDTWWVWSSLSCCISVAYCCWEGKR